jgi:hypothetical protein
MNRIRQFAELTPQERFLLLPVTPLVTGVA